MRAIAPVSDACAPAEAEFRPTRPVSNFMYATFRSRLQLTLCVGVAAFLAIASPAIAASKGKFQIEEATIADIHAAILAKELTTTQLVKLYLARIKAFNGPGV